MEKVYNGCNLTNILNSSILKAICYFDNEIQGLLVLDITCPF